MDNKVAIIGSMDSYMGFRALGVEVSDPVIEERNAVEILESLSPEEYTIVFIAENYAEQMMDEISKRNKDTTQSVIIIPSGHTTKGIAGERIRNLVRRAVGADVV